MDKLCLKEKVAIITGSSAGIGESTAKLFSQRGAALVLHGRQEEKLREVAEACQKLSPTNLKPEYVIGDINDEAVREKLISTAVNKFGHLDILVNNAGYGTGAPFSQLKMEDLRSMLEIHAVAPYDLTLKAFPHLEKTSGAVVNVTSVAGSRVLRGTICYSTAKAALEHLTRTMAIEVADKGVRINAVAPGYVVTDIVRNLGNDGAGRQLMKQMGTIQPIKRAGESGEIAETIAFLASPASSLITGEIVHADGGFQCSLPAPDIPRPKES